MKTGKASLSLPLVLLVVFAAVLPAMAADGTVAGTVTLETETGRVEPGTWIRILLVTRAVDVPQPEASIPPDHPDYVDTVNSMHTGFYIQVQNQLADQAYLYASTLTTDEGSFKLPAIAPGNYFLVVKFPGNIRGYKVAWQVPVIVMPGKTVTVDLNRSNLALPTVKR